MPNAEMLIFRGAKVLRAHICRDQAGVFNRIYMSSDFTEAVRDEMGWGDPPNGFTQGKLEGALNASHVMLTPDRQDLRQFELNMDVTEISDFQFFVVNDSKNDTSSTELHFTIRTPTDGAESQVANYLRRVGDTASQLRVSYQRIPKQPGLPGIGKDDRQQELPGTDGAGETDCVDCNNSVPLREGDPSTHESGQPCKAYKGHEDGSAPLASVATMKPRPTAEEKQKRTRLISANQ